MSISLDTVPRCRTCKELCDSADGENRCYNPLDSRIGDCDQSIEVRPDVDFCSNHSLLRKRPKPARDKGRPGRS